MTFIIMLTFFVALLAGQLLRGTLPFRTNDGTYTITFSDPLNSFIGIYQILSTDRWSDILFDVTAYSRGSASAILGPIFMIIWFMSVQCMQPRPPCVLSFSSRNHRCALCVHRNVPVESRNLGTRKIQATVSRVFDQR
jgi:hypothetical protein